MNQWFQNYIKKQSKHDERTAIGILAGKVGLISNVLLFGVKLFAGLMAGSISIMTDAINNLADSGSSVLTLFGFHMATKPPDKKHPYGHERSEYITGLIISMIIIYVGVEFLTTSIEKIFNPTSLRTTPLVFVLLVGSIVAKFLQGYFYRKAAENISSNTLDGAAQDSLNDAYVTIIVLFAAVVESFTGWMIDGYAGAFLAVFIIYSGIQMIRKSIDDLLGTRPSAEQLQKMKDVLDEVDSIVGYHDLLVHNYGPQKTFASIDIEIDDRWSLTEAHQLINQIEKRFKDELNVELVSHVDPIAIQDEQDSQIYRQVKQILKSYSLNLKFHDFRIEELDGETTLQFDVVIPDYTEQTNEELYEALEADIREKIGNYSVKIEFDRHDLLKELEEKAEE